MGRLLKLIWLLLPFNNFGELFNNDAHSIISRRGKQILFEQHESDNCGK